ncbi:MAG: acetolactate synthase small subunit [Clostridia bacterium]|nr:acetolactate synthase small subunit [Clostridia bacterium]
MKQRIISFIVSNQPGVLSRVAGLISRRGFNIDSLTVGVTQDTSLSRITIVMNADDQIAQQVIKQLEKLIDVKHVKEIESGMQTLSEVALIKLNSEKNKVELMEKIGQLWGRVVDMGEKTTTIEITGRTEYINESIKELEHYGIEEIARTGMVALERGDIVLNNFEL